MSGMEMLLKSMGVDPAKILSDFSKLTDGVIQTLQKLDERMDRIETSQAKVAGLTKELTDLLKETNPVLLSDLAGLKTRMEELCQMTQHALSMSSQVRLVQPQPNQPQETPPEKPALPLLPLNQP